MIRIKNRKGSDGRINETGKPGSPSRILDVRDADFFENVEDGIKSTVRAVISSGFETISSCQGHNDLGYVNRTVSLLLESDEIIYWRTMIADLNIVNGFRRPIKYFVSNYKDGIKKFMIIFGSVQDMKETELKQQAFDKTVPKIIKEYYGSKCLNTADYAYSGIHIDEFY